MAKARITADTAFAPPATDPQDALRALVRLIARDVARDLMAAETQRPTPMSQETR